MPEIRFEGRAFAKAAGETVLSCLESNGVRVESFCRSGVCQSCLLRATEGTPPASAQVGLKEAWKRQGYFLACVCDPETDLEVSRCDVTRSHRTRIAHVSPLSSDVLRVVLEAPTGFVFEAGQFIQLQRPSDGLMRPYSIASLPSSGALELHVALLPGGQMSQWLVTASGEPMDIRGPFGECMHLPGELERPLVLAGTGTGLAPLLGILRAALEAGHTAPIQLIHGSVHARGLYLWSELCRLQTEVRNLNVVGSVLQGAETASGTVVTGSDRAPPSIVSTPLDQLVMSSPVKWSEQRVYLCGHPDLVRTLRKKVFLAGTPLQRIHADPFLPPKNASA